MCDKSGPSCCQSGAAFEPVVGMVDRGVSPHCESDVYGLGSDAMSDFCDNCSERTSPEIFNTCETATLVASTMVPSLARVRISASPSYGSW